MNDKKSKEQGDEFTHLVTLDMATDYIGEYPSPPLSPINTALELTAVSSLESYYVLGPTIGRGEFAKVKLAKSLANGQKVAVKIVKTGSTDQQSPSNERLLREITILSGITHPNIIKLIEVLKLPDRIAIVMEYAPGGELFDHVQKRGHLREMEIKSIMMQIFQAVEYLHHNGIVHRDLKLENILMGVGGRIYLSDFGFSKISLPGQLLKTACGSPCYAAPELVLDKAGYYGKVSDIWSCGVIMYAMNYGHLPFEGDLTLDRQGSDPVNWTPTNVYQLYQHIVSNPIKLPKGFSDGLGRHGLHLLLRILDPVPKTRISLHEIFAHPWFNSTCS